MKRIPLLTATAILVPVLALAGCGPARPDPATVVKATPIATTAAGANGGLTANGTGSVSGAPDVMTISLTVETKAPHAADALTQNSSLTTAVINSLRMRGVADKDIQTAQLNVYPQYDGNGRTISGYQVDNSVAAKLRDLSKAGQVIDAAVGAAGDAGRLSGVTFSFDDRSQLLAEARRDAVSNAVSQAEQLAAAAGGKLGPLRSLSEETSQPPQSFNAVPALGGAPSTPIQPGSQELTVQVTGTWDIT